MERWVYPGSTRGGFAPPSLPSYFWGHQTHMHHLHHPHHLNHLRHPHHPHHPHNPHHPHHHLSWKISYPLAQTVPARQTIEVFVRNNVNAHFYCRRINFYLSPSTFFSTPHFSLQKYIDQIASRKKYKDNSSLIESWSDLQHWIFLSSDSLTFKLWGETYLEQKKKYEKAYAYI